MKFGEVSQEGENKENNSNNSPAPSAPEGNSGDGGRKKKLIMAGGVLAVLILAVAGWQYWQYTQTPYYQQMKMVEAIDESIKESDKWGGKTPEETVKLFTEAVKKGDFELAGKYGSPELITPKLEQLKTGGKIDVLISGLEKGELEENKGFDGNSFDLRVKEGGENYWIMGLFKSDSGTWKIDEF